MHTPALETALRRGAVSLSLVLGDVQVGQLLDYLGLLQKWGRVYNLTAVRDPQDMLTHHLLDSLAVIGPLQRQLGAMGRAASGVRLLDVGSGAGLPGAVIAICFAELAVTCVDSTNEGYDALFPTGHAFLGLTDVMGNRNNVASGAFHFMVRPVDQLTINLDWHVFGVPERGAVVSNFAGQEGNLGVLWTPWPGFRTRAMYGVFLPETAGWRQPGGLAPYTTSPVHFLEVEIGFVLR